ncbi:unnamed protein product [Bubo scandiacus]
MSVGQPNMLRCDPSHLEPRDMVCLVAPPVGETTMDRRVEQKSCEEHLKSQQPELYLCLRGILLPDLTQNSHSGLNGTILDCTNQVCDLKAEACLGRPQKFDHQYNTWSGQQNCQYSWKLQGI